MAIDSTAEDERLRNEHSPLYWFFVNIKRGLVGHVLRHKLIYSVLGCCSLLVAFSLRAMIQPLFIWFRLHTFDLFLITMLVLGVRVLSKKLAEKGKRLRRTTKLLAFVFVVVLIRVEVYSYFANYSRYRHLKEIDLEELPTTAHERVQPIESLRTLADGVMDQNRHPSEPDFVRIGDKYCFTMAVEPDTWLTRLVGTIDEIIDIPGNAASPDFSKDSRHQVSFAIGEHMFLGKNSRNATIKTFPLWRFFSYTPGDVKYVQDDSGEMVEIVSLSRLSGSWWSRWVFPWPEFGGVVVIRQSNGGLVHALKRVFFGDGTWVPPEKIHEYAFLRGQNLVPYEASRYAAKSFRFERSFWAPCPIGNHNGDTIIPDMKDSKNDMPYTVYAKFGADGDERNKLYHYFALEPWQSTQHGLSNSLFFPADGIGRPLVFRHYKRDEGTHGVATVDSQVRGSDIHVSWASALPIEHRPWIHDIAGKRRLMWLTTVVTFKEGNSRLSASSMPNIVLTDARTGRSLWVKATYPEGWVAEVDKDYLDSVGGKKK